MGIRNISLSSVTKIGEILASEPCLGFNKHICTAPDRPFLLLNWDISTHAVHSLKKAEPKAIIEEKGDWDKEIIEHKSKKTTALKSLKVKTKDKSETSYENHFTNLSTMEDEEDPKVN